MKKNIKIEDLLKFWGTPFIENIYKIAFDSYPDVEGLNYYRDKLDQGVSRIKIIEQITSSTNSKISLKDIEGAEGLLNKTTKREHIRKKFKSVKPVYLILTSLEKKFFTNERITMNSIYEIKHLLTSNTFTNSRQSNLVNKDLPSINISENFEMLSESDKLLYSQISRNLFN